jgi:branched-chain amino acid transport system substrate-binding protein
MAAQMKSLAIKAKLLGGDGAQSVEFLKLAGRAAEGSIASSPGLPLDKMPGGKGFTDRFTAKYGQIQIYAPYAYDATMTLIEAMQKANSADPKKYLAELAKTNRQGVTGPIAFDDKGDLRDGPMTLYVVKSGKWEALETIGGPTAAVAPASAPAAAPAPAEKPAAAPAEKK